jgi:hypothetical protein
MASQQISPKGKHRNGSGGLYGMEMGILYGPGIASGALPFLYKKPNGVVIFIGP